MDASSSIHGACKLCDQPTFAFDAVDFNKFCDYDYYRFGFAGEQVCYYKCVSCGFLMTRHFDDWSASEFKKRIYNEDYIKVDGEYATIRPSRLASLFLKDLREGLSGRCLDYGSGSGVFAQALERGGVHGIFCYDPFSMPQRPQGRFDTITCFEVVEHTPEPLLTWNDIFSFLSDQGTLIVSTGLQPPDIDERRGTWWYVGPRNGHCSIYSYKAMLRVASTFSLSFATAHGFCIFSKNIRNFEKFKEFTLWGEATLTAPKLDDERWHAIESSGLQQSYRWSKSNSLIWRLDGFPKDMQVLVELPALMEIKPGYAKQCKLTVDGVDRTTSLSRRGDHFCLTADIRGTGEELRIELKLPDPIRPDTMGGSDSRELGLAVIV